MNSQYTRVDRSDLVEFRPNPTRQTFLLRMWRNTLEEAWRYTVVIPNVERQRHFRTLADATAFIDAIMQQ